MGTPAQRERQYRQVRAMKAQERVLEHRVQKAQASEGALMEKKTGYYKKHAIKTKYGYERVVEDLIQEAMSKGEFTKLDGAGKPLPNRQQQNPYVDFVTHKMNNILLDNGFTPEWIALQKDIRSEIEEIRNDFMADRKTLGPIPLSPNDTAIWDKICSKYEKRVNGLNKKIDDFNLIVPILNKQLFRIQLENIAGEILKNGQFRSGDEIKEPQQVLVKQKHNDSLLGLIGSFL